MHFRYQKLAMDILGFVNMNKTERITYAFNMRAPGGRYYSVRYSHKALIFKQSSQMKLSLG